MPALAFDCSDKSLSAAVIAAGKSLAEVFYQGGEKHSVTLLPILERLCAECKIDIAEMDYIALTVGPGAFTALRIAAATAKGFALALQTPLVGVSTLLALALNAVAASSISGASICPMLGARGGLVYTATFTYELVSISPERLCSLKEAIAILPKTEKMIFLGDGARANQEAILDAFGKHAIFGNNVDDYVRASNLGIYAAGLFAQNKLLNPLAFTPAYLQASYAEKGE